MQKQKAVQQSPQLHKKRMANIEALRLFAMMMVISLHYLAKGELLEELTAPLSLQGHLAWLLESFSIAAVDVYVLVSGYFLVETGFRCERIISLVLQVMFYTCLMPVVLVLAGILPVSEITFYNILQYIFPTNMLHYWFVSAYVLMFLFTPVLNAAVHAMKKKQLQAAIFILLLMESVSKTVIPVRLELDNLGYDAYWFMVVYLIAAYIRLYGISFLDGKKNRAVWVYILLCFAIYGLTMLIRGAYLLTGQFTNFIESPFGYNHLLVIAAAVALFYAFKDWSFGNSANIREAKKCNVGRGKAAGEKAAGGKVAGENAAGGNATGKKAGLSQRMADFICKIAPCSFGVYLLHEHVNIRYEWPFWLGAGQCDSALSLFWHWLVAICIVLIAGLVVDYIRSLLFKGIAKLFIGGRLDKMLKRVDDRINGKENEG